MANRARPAPRFGECCRRPPRTEIAGGDEARLEPDDDRDVTPFRAPPIAADRTSSAVDCESKKRWYGVRAGGVDAAIGTPVPEHAVGGRIHEIDVS